MNWRDIPSLSALRALEAVAREGSITKAADTLNVTHAAIAQHIRALEVELKTKLTHRVGRGIALTNDGSQLASALSEGFGHIHAGIKAITDTDADRPLNVTATPSFAENWLLPRLGDFWRTYPEITLSITPSFDVVDLNRDPFDLAIRYGKGDWSGVASTFLVSADYVLAAAPGLLAGRKPQGIADLQGETWLFDSLHREPRRWAEENGLDLSCCQVREFETLGMVLSALRAGVGVSVVSKTLIARDIENGDLQTVLDIPAAGMAYHIVTRKGRQMPKVDTFKKWLLQSV